MKNRIVSLDYMRGVVIVLMAIDHASSAFNGGRFAADSHFFYRPGMELPVDQFLTRWITHLCAPAFLFLAGAALALSIERRVRDGHSNWSINRRLLVRGSLIALLDVIWISIFWAPGRILLQVLYAIGISMILMIPLRTLSNRWLAGIAIGFFIGAESILNALGSSTDQSTSVLLTLTLYPGLVDVFACLYPVLPWLAMMILGWVFGRYLLTWWGTETTRRALPVILSVVGVIALFLFVLLRGLNGYGNMALLRDDSSLVQWLLVSKYPPSLTFVLLEGGLIALVLGGLFWRENRRDKPMGRNHPLLVFGQTSLFFYLLHIPILEVTARLFGLQKSAGLSMTYVAAAGVLIALYPLCRWYRSYKRAHPNSPLQYI
ncbi:MAG: heparan-alpha-glucosaminide N-acetyltransferase domain-containing protein [Proteobacteria bacterium]|nr:heparan-alpha-glucosaminide N-acetyltransferase domain-containing protein [Pseudomonadota bacterium]